jgi:hypothetical protein
LDADSHKVRELKKSHRKGESNHGSKKGSEWEDGILNKIDEVAEKSPQQQLKVTRQ